MKKGLILLLIGSLMLSGCSLVKTPQSPTTPAIPSSSSLPSSSPTSTPSPTASLTRLSVTWTPIKQGNFPPDRLDYDLTYDSKRDRLLFFGGATIEAGVPLKDLWAFDFSTNLWELLSEGKELPSPLHYPHPKSHQDIVYDPLKDRLLLFQCSPSERPQFVEGNPSLLSSDTRSPTSEYEVQVYAFNFMDHGWTQLNPSQKPPDRLEWFRVVWDAKSNRVFLFGGRLIVQAPGSSEVQEVQAKDLWVFDCKEDHWQELADNITLPGTYPLTLGPSSYDPQEDRLLILKPKKNDENLYDVSVLKLSETFWVDLQSLNPPSFQELRYVAYDPRFHVLILPVRSENKTSGELKEEVWIYDLDGNDWSYCGDLPGNSQEHLIVPGKPGEAYTLTKEIDESPRHNLWHLILSP